MDSRDRDVERQLKLVEAEALRAADVLTQGFSKDARATVESVVLSLATMSVIGTDSDRIAALRCVGQTLVGLAEREYQYLYNEKNRRQMMEARTGRTPTRSADTSWGE